MPAFRAVVFSLLLIVCAPASAQTPDPVRTHYRAFNDALAAGDLQRAESEAEQALAASQSRDGDGGSTGALALNLALVRIEAGDAASALEPAALAHRISGVTGASAGMDPLLVRLTLGQAELATGGRAGLERLTEALTEAEGRSDLSEHIVNAANAIGIWSFEQGDFDRARHAFATVSRHATGDDTIAAFIRARAKTGEAAALLSTPRARDNYHEAYALLEEAVAALGLVRVSVNARGGDPTPLEFAYGEAMAWRIMARMHRPRGAQEEPIQRAAGPPPISLTGAQACPVALLELPDNLSRYYPDRALRKRQTGIVVLRLVIDEAGTVSRTDAVAFAPRQMFARAATHIMERARVRRAEGAPVDCEMPQILFVPVQFGFGGEQQSLTER